jgi:chitinase
MTMRQTFWLVISLVQFSAAVSAAPAHDATPVVTGYVFAPGQLLQPGQIQARGISRLNYAFARIRDGQMVEGSPNDAANLAQLDALRGQHPGVAVLVSVGGWTWSDGFSDAALTKQSRAVFIDSAIAFLRRYDLDGLDVDWEYPGQPGAGHTFRPEDKHNFTLLLKELRARLDEESTQMNRRLLLTIAAGATSEYLEHTEMGQVQKWVDAVNLMTYDYYSPGSDAITGNHAPLLENPIDPKHVSAAASVQAFESAGVPASKILLGIPFYGHLWGDVADSAHGLFQPARPAASRDIPYSAIPAWREQGFTRYWDSASQVPYLYNASERQFLSYEDTESAAGKASYAKAKGLQGVMFWNELNDPSGELLRRIDQALHGDAPRSTPSD